MDVFTSWTFQLNNVFFKHIVDTAAFSIGRSFCIGVLAGCVQRVFVQAMINYYDFGYFRPFSSSYTKAQLAVHDNKDLCANLYIMVGAPVVEELAYRWAIQEAVCRITGSPLAGVVVSSGLFGAVHLRNGHERVVTQAVITGLSGIIFGTLNHKLGLAASIGAHIAHNSLYRIASITWKRPRLNLAKRGRILPPHTHLPASALSKAPISIRA